ncbi:hypothetical protein [Paraburkholderia humisilvae]|uniref:Uncharacterized protein n=1 Tax=Paraburkholderia humisilvae TaxID=627669 RepID=A0A6J5EVX8_9BURK|nr:hypothetical protein LMG29542_06432 [Paraburkholderia humisilvae]
MIGTNLVLPAGVATPPLVASAGERASVRLLEYFASAIRNPRTRRAYAWATGDFSGGAPAPG